MSLSRGGGGGGGCTSKQFVRPQREGGALRLEKMKKNGIWMTMDRGTT